jgi:iron complex transport system ATP-binding protein
MSGRVLIRAESLSASYPGSRGKRDTDVIKDVSFTLREGERLAVIGPNGSGKTTLLRALAGTIPYRGSLHALVTDTESPKEGREVERSSLKPREAAREMAFLAQLSAQAFPFTVEYAVSLGRYARQRRGFNPPPDIRDRDAVREAMAACGVLDIAREPVDRLSGGQAQRVFLARALAQESAVLLLDEPTNHLDLRYQIELVDLVAARTCASIGVFHDLTLALRFADSMLLLDRGRVADYGSPRDVLAGGAIDRAYGLKVSETIRALLQNW